MPSYIDPVETEFIHWVPGQKANAQVETEQAETIESLVRQVELADAALAHCNTDFLFINR